MTQGVNQQILTQILFGDSGNILNKLINLKLIIKSDFKEFQEDINKIEGDIKIPLNILVDMYNKFRDARPNKIIIIQYNNKNNRFTKQELYNYLTDIDNQIKDITYNLLKKYNIEFTVDNL